MNPIEIILLLAGGFLVIGLSYATARIWEKFDQYFRKKK